MPAYRDGLPATATECGWPGCHATPTTDGHCEHHYRRRLHTGRGGFRDAARAREHVQALRSLGWTYEQISQASGLSSAVPHGLLAGRCKRLRHRSETALLSVPLVPAASHRGTDATGTRRRVQALAWMGWPAREVAQRAGTTAATLQTEIYRGRLSVALAARVRGVYEDLSARPGPSSMAARKARQFGWAPPAAWDGVDMDRPKARPVGVRRDAA